MFEIKKSRKMTPSKHSLYEQEGSEVELSATNVARWDTAFSGGMMVSKVFFHSRYICVSI